MAYIGNQPTSAAFLTDQFSGNGSTVAFIMSVAPANTASIIVAVSGVVQDPTTYSVNATTLTFSTAPPSGIGNISVRYLGIPAAGVTTTAYRTVTEFTATADQTVFAVPSYTVGYIDVYRNGVRLGTADYTATTGTSVTLLNAATAGDLVVTESFYVSSVLNAIPSVGGAINTLYLDAGSANGTGAILMPSGTTAQRPAAPIVGMQRWNTTISGMEIYVASGIWQAIASASYSVDFLIVAGGAGGAAGYSGGGGGAGGYIVGNPTSVTPGTSYSIIVGAGGTGTAAYNNGNSTWTPNSGGNGSNSSAFTFTAIGGGGGRGAIGGGIGNAGGSGGGGSDAGAGGAGTAGQGFAGGAGASAPNYGAGGGGGAGGVGGNGSTAVGGNGGPGLYSTISGALTAYAGGGGGGTYNGGTGGTGGVGGGGAGSPNSTAAISGTANTGGGGGGTGTSAYVVGAAGNGGSGVVIVRYAGTVARASGGTITISGGFVVHTFTTSGTFVA